MVFLWCLFVLTVDFALLDFLPDLPARCFRVFPRPNNPFILSTMDFFGGSTAVLDSTPVSSL